MSDMNKAVERYRKHGHKVQWPNVQGFEGEAFDALRKCMDGVADAEVRKVTFRRGLSEDLRPQLWWRVTANGVVAGEGNNSFNCPPLPPEYCDE